MRDIIFIFSRYGKVCQATVHQDQAEQFERGLGDNMLGKVVLAAR